MSIWVCGTQLLSRSILSSESQSLVFNPSREISLIGSLVSKHKTVTWSHVALCCLGRACSWLWFASQALAFQDKTCSCLLPGENRGTAWPLMICNPLHMENSITLNNSLERNTEDCEEEVWLNHAVWDSEVALDLWLSSVLEITITLCKRINAEVVVKELSNEFTSHHADANAQL